MTQREAYKKFVHYMTQLKMRGLTFKEISKLLGVHERTIYKWMSKQREIGPLLLLAMEKIASEKTA